MSCAASGTPIVGAPLFIETPIGALANSAGAPGRTSWENETPESDSATTWAVVPSWCGGVLAPYMTNGDQMTAWPARAKTFAPSSIVPSHFSGVLQLASATVTAFRSTKSAPKTIRHISIASSEAAFEYELAQTGLSE